MADSQRHAADDLDALRRRANRRLLGAAVLLLVAIIAVPLLLEREPPVLQDTVEVRIPPIEGSSFEHKLDANPAAKAAKPAPRKTPEPPALQEPSGERVATAAPTSAAAAGARAVPPKTESAPPPSTIAAASSAPHQTAPAEAQAAQKAGLPAIPPSATPPSPLQSAAKTTTPPTASAESAAQKKAGQLVVQILAVRDSAAAKAVADRARSLKYPVYTERIDVANGVVTRVRVGPYDSKQAAEVARAQLARDGFEAKVVTLQ
ncbi:MAG: SPOR domain-containing protein [Casimicrobiaceae bacterium]